MNKCVEEANMFFKHVAALLGDPLDIDCAVRVTTAIWHTLRDRIEPEESMHLISHLPVILKGFYIDGWKISMKKVDTKSLDEFLDEVRAHDLGAAARDFGNDEQARAAVKAVLFAMHHYAADGEISYMKNNLPEPISALLEEPI